MDGAGGGLFGGPRAGMSWLTGVPNKAYPTSRSAQRAGRLALPGAAGRAWLRAMSAAQQSGRAGCVHL